jgi:hypothetical protein
MINGELQFSLKNYQRILSRAQEMEFVFQTFAGYLEDPRQKMILLRHDVDVSLEYALQLAEIEHELAINSTFFVRLHAHFYNLLEEANIRRLRKLAKMGFEVGLHQELYKFTDDRQAAVKLLTREKILVETLLGKSLSGVASHLPRHNTISLTPEFLAEAGFKYRAGGEIFNKDAIFITDSNKRWKPLSLEEALERSDKILANIHPVWWVGQVQDVDGLINLLKQGH